MILFLYSCLKLPYFIYFCDMKHEESSVKLLSTDLPINVAPLHLSLCRGRELKVDGCVFMRVLKGDAVFSINASQVRIESGMLLYLAFDMTIISVQDAELDVECLYIDSIVTREIFFNITSSAFWGFIYASPAFIPAPGLEGYMKRWFEQTQWIQKKFASNVVQATLRNEVETLFVVLAAEIEGMDTGAGLPKTRAWAIANDFITLVHRNYTRHHDVAYYADKLNISADYLNVICRENLGYTAKSRIDSQIIISIKTLLDTTDLPIKAIAEHLHYENPSYMCRVFRRITGQTPMEYRNRLRP